MSRVTLRDQILAVIADGTKRPLNCSALYRLESEHGIERVGEEMDSLERDGAARAEGRAECGGAE